MKSSLASPQRSFAAVALAVAVAALLHGCAAPGNPVAPNRAAKSGVEDNFGYPLMFSPVKMDPSADPRQDFRRYAAGRWLDAATIPSDQAQVSGYLVMARAVQAQLLAIVEDAANTAASAPKGSPRQQVGDFYASGMDERRLTELGVKPIQPELTRIAAIDGPVALAQALARLEMTTGSMVVVGATVSTDPQDRSRHAIYVGDGDLMFGADNYLDPKAEPIRAAYVRMIAAKLAIAGYAPEAAQAAAKSVLAIETRIARAKLSPVERMDPHKRFVRTSYADFRRVMSNVDVDSLFRSLGLPAGGEVIVVEGRALAERNAMLAELPIGETRAYLQWELLRHTSKYLTPAFREPTAAFNRALYGPVDQPPRNKEVAAQVPEALGHPLSQLYVAKHLPPESKRAVEDLVGRIRAEFRERMASNTWLSPSTRTQAIAKLDAMDIRVGYPAVWIDFSSVDIRRDDYYGNVVRLNEFQARRELARLGKPVTVDGFAIAGRTLPIDINAAYQMDRNGIEIPAAFLQPPFYDAKADAAVNFCSMGAVIGHELTHGFDSQGRMFDANGGVRDWWARADETHFVGEVRKLARQADAYEVLPGLRLNGALEVGENLADVGGIALGYGALRTWLRDHPQQDRASEGLTPTQRCFLAWAQLWPDKTNEAALRQTIPTDGHPTGVYRMLAPSQHQQAFFDAFGIRAGDPVWLAPSDRVAIW